jgi:hypothetical protein
MITGERGARNPQALFGKRPTEKDLGQGHLADGRVNVYNPGRVL